MEALIELLTENRELGLFLVAIFGYLGIIDKHNFHPYVKSILAVAVLALAYLAYVQHFSEKILALNHKLESLEKDFRSKSRALNTCSTQLLEKAGNLQLVTQGAIEDGRTYSHTLAQTADTIGTLRTKNKRLSLDNTQLTGEKNQLFAANQEKDSTLAQKNLTIRQKDNEISTWKQYYTGALNVTKNVRDSIKMETERRSNGNSINTNKKVVLFENQLYEFGFPILFLQCSDTQTEFTLSSEDINKIRIFSAMVRRTSAQSITVRLVGQSSHTNRRERDRLCNQRCDFIARQLGGYLDLTNCRRRFLGKKITCIEKYLYQTEASPGVYLTITR